MRTGLRCGPSVVSSTTPTPLCVSLGCAHSHNEGLHRGLLPRRGPSVRSAPLVCHRPIVSLSPSSDFFVTFARYFSSCSDDVLFLCSSSHASQCQSHSGVMRLRVKFLTLLSSIARWSDSTLLNCSRSRLSAGCGSVFSFLFTCYCAQSFS